MSSYTVSANLPPNGVSVSNSINNYTADIQLNISTAAYKILSATVTVSSQSVFGQQADYYFFAYWDGSSLPLGNPNPTLNETQNWEYVTVGDILNGKNSLHLDFVFGGTSQTATITGASVTFNFSSIALTPSDDTAYVGPGLGSSVSADVAHGVLANDYDPYHLEKLSVTRVTVVTDGQNVTGKVGASLAGVHGNLTLNGDGSYTYTSTDNTNAGDTFTYTVTDSTSSATATATLTIMPDLGPKATTHDFSVTQQQTVSGALGDTDPDMDQVTVTKVAGEAPNGSIIPPFGTNINTVAVGGTYGELTIGKDDTFTYVADKTSAINSAPTGSHPVDTFSYTVSDGNGSTATETVSFTIDRVPYFIGTHYLTAVAVEGTTITGSFSNLYRDDDGDPLTFSLPTHPIYNYGSFTLKSDGSYSYTANTSIDGASNPIEYVTYYISDGHGGQMNDAIEITIERPGPTGLSVSGQPVNGSQITVTGTGETVGDTIKLYDGVTLVGTGTVGAGGAFSITTSSTFADGSHTLTATETDSSNLASAKSTGLTANVDPAAPAITGQVGSGSLIEVTGSGEVGDTIKLYSGVTLVGTGTVGAGGTFDITSTAAFTDGTYMLTATETDSSNLTSTLSKGFVATVYPTLTGVTAAPSTGTEGPGETILFKLAFGEAVDVAGGGIPTLTLNDGGTATLTGGSGTNDLTFSYTVEGSDANSSLLAVTGINLNGATIEDGAGNNAVLNNVATNFPGLAIDNSVPVTNPDMAHAVANQTITISAAYGVLANDSDSNSSDVLSVSAVDGLAADVNQPVAGAYGTLTLHNDGSYNYTASNASAQLPYGVGEDVFSYAANNGHGGTTTTTFTVIVTSPNENYLTGSTGQTLNAQFGNWVLDGSAGNMTLNASITFNSHQVLIGGNGDTLNGSHYGLDEFMFAPNFGNETISNFEPSRNVIALPHVDFANFAAVMAHAQQVNADTVITLDAHDTITIKDTVISSLNASNVHIV
jgi:VCBS repeat-containing protein